MAEKTRTDEVLAVLRNPTHRPQLFRGFGPLVVGALFMVVMVMLLPSVAPERIVERPVGPDSTSTSTTTTSTTVAGG